MSEGELPVLIGMRAREQKLAAPEKAKPNTLVCATPVPTPVVREVVSGALPIYVDGAVMFKNDLHDRESSIGGEAKRSAADPPKANRQLRRRLARFVRKWLERNLTPLDCAADDSVERWLEHSNYPEWRKKEILEAWENVISDCLKSSHVVCDTFVKDEFYPEPKWPRLIHARRDEFKAFSGPIFKLIEEQLYQHPAFIKHVPVAQRPQYILDNVYLPGAKMYTTDYTSFESLFTKMLMDTVEMQLYEYMTKNLPRGKVWYDNVYRVMTGRNHCSAKHFKMQIDATRMSGEMSTSLGNGFSNLMLASFVVAEKGGHDLRIVVEGDDGLFTYSGPEVKTEDFTELGLRIKIDSHDELATASFCGLVFDPVDLVNVRDPRTVFATFGWTGARDSFSGKKKKLALLRAKSMSLLAQYPGCPMLQSLAMYGMRVTKSYDITRVIQSRNTGWWIREQYLEAQQLLQAGSLRPQPVPNNTRLLIERLYGISVETQLHVEAYLDALDVVQPIRCSVLDDLLPSAWKAHWDEYVRLGNKPSQQNIMQPLGGDNPSSYDTLVSTSLPGRWHRLP